MTFFSVCLEPAPCSACRSSLFLDPSALFSGKSHGQRSLVGCSPWGRWGSDATERLHFQFSLSCIGEGNGNPLQCSCLENPRDGGAWCAAVYGVAQSRTRLKRLSSSSSSSTVFYNMVQDMPYLSSFFLNHSSVAGCFCCFWFLTMRTGEKAQCGPLDVGKNIFSWLLFVMLIIVMKKYCFLHVDGVESTLWFPPSPRSSLPSSACAWAVQPWSPRPGVTVLPVSLLLGFLSPSPWMMLACSPTSCCHGSARSWFEVYGEA